MTTIRG